MFSNDYLKLIDENYEISNKDEEIYCKNKYIGMKEGK